MIYKINLLPHRERARAFRRTQFYLMLVIAAGIGGVAAFGWGAWSNNRHNVQLERNKLLEERIKALDKKIEEVKLVKKELAELKARRDAVSNLQKDRVLPVGIMKDIAALIPEGVFLRTLKQEDGNKKLVLTGFAVVPKLVSDTSNGLSRDAKWIEKVIPQETKEVVGLTDNPNASTNKKDQRKFYLFNLMGELRNRTLDASKNTPLAVPNEVPPNGSKALPGAAGANLVPAPNSVPAQPSAPVVPSSPAPATTTSPAAQQKK